MPELNIEFNLPCLLLRFKRSFPRFRKYVVRCGSISGINRVR